MTAPMRFDLPTIDEDTQAFWDGTRAGRLLIRHCTACGAHHYYPRTFCPECWSDSVEWVEASGRATLYTHSTVYINDLPPFNEQVPYIAAVVDLEEGPRMMTRLSGAETDELVIGMALEAVFEPADDEGDVVLVHFRPRADERGGRTTIRVLVTGATGFLGSRVAGQLLDRGDEVRALVRSTSDRSRLEGLAVGYADGDVTDRAAVADALDGVDWVVHCAAMVELGPRDPSKLERVNVIGTRNVLEQAAERDVRALHVSSLSATGPTPPDEPPKDEWWWDHAPRAVVYEETKRRAHELARALAVDGASVRIAMPGGIYGFGDSSTMADLIAAYTRYPIPIGYLPEVRQSMVNVDDCADALLRIIDSAKDGDEFVVAADTATIAEWLDIIVRAAVIAEPRIYLSTKRLRSLAGPGGRVATWFGQSPTMVPETIAVATHDASYTGDKLRRQLGWAPRPLEVGMQEMVDAIKADDAAKRATKTRPSLAPVRAFS